MRAIAGALIGVGLAWMAPTHAENPSPSVQVQHVLQKMQDKRDRKDFTGWAELYGEACEAGHADSCSELAWATRSDPDKQAGLYLRACELGGVDSCARSGKALLKVSGYTADAKRLLSDACAQDRASACRDLGYAYKVGQGLDKSASQAKIYLERACALQDEQACKAIPESDLEFDGVEATMRAGAARMQALKDERLIQDAAREKKAINEHLYKAQKAQARESKLRHLRSACDLGDSSACAGAAVISDQGQAASLLALACELNGFYCVQASALSRDEVQAQQLLVHGCQNMATSDACLKLIDRVKSGAPSTWDHKKIEYYEALRCQVQLAARGPSQNMRSACPQYLAYIASRKPEAVAQVEDERRWAQLGLRVVPLGAHAICADQESAQFASQMGRAKRDPAGALKLYRDFVQRCGGHYIKTYLQPACERVAGRAISQRLICALKEGELSNGYSDSTSGLQLTTTELERDFHFVPTNGGLSAGTTGDHLVPSDTVNVALPGGQHPQSFPWLALRPQSQAHADGVYLSERVHFEFSRNRVVASVPHSGHELGTEPLNWAWLQAYPGDSFDPNAAEDPFRAHRQGWSPQRVQHHAQWDADLQRWHAATEFQFDIQPEVLSALPADTRLYLLYKVNGRAYFVAPEPAIQQRWVLTAVFADALQGVPGPAVAAAMQAARAQPIVDFDALCGKYRSGWVGHRGDLFNQRRSRVQSQRTLLDCRLRHAQQQRSGLQARPAATQTDPDHWYRILLEQRLELEQRNLAGWNEEWSRADALLEADVREARAADRRDERERRNELRAQQPDKAAEYMAYLDQENYRRQLRGLPPIGVDSGGDARKEKPRTHSARAPGSTSKPKSGSGASTTDAVLCLGHADPDQNTCLSATERAQRKAAIAREQGAERLRTWAAEQRAECDAENRVGVRCVLTASEPTTLDYAQQGLPGYQSRSKLNPATGECPPREDQGNQILGWKALPQPPDQPACTVRQDGEMGLILCRGRQTWTCEPKIEKKLGGMR